MKTGKKHLDIEDIYEDLDVRCVIFEAIKTSQSKNQQEGCKLHTEPYYSIRERLTEGKWGVVLAEENGPQ